MAEAQPRKPPRKRASGIVAPRQLHWYHHVFAWLIAAGVRVFSCTWLCHFVDPHEGLKRLTGPAIFCVWHNRLALSTTIWQRWGKTNPAAGLVALISASHDGGILSRALEYFDVKAVRGSSSRRGAQALLELTSWLERGYHIAITPDGPRGPKYTLQDGIIALAQISSVPIVPIGARVCGKLIMRSWDQFQVPLPFARCEVEVGKMVYVPREATDADREALKCELEKTMRALNVD